MTQPVTSEQEKLLSLLCNEQEDVRLQGRDLFEMLGLDYLKGTDLNGRDFSKVDLRGVDFGGANFDGSFGQCLPTLGG